MAPKKVEEELHLGYIGSVRDRFLSLLPSAGRVRLFARPAEPAHSELIREPWARLERATNLAGRTFARPPRANGASLPALASLHKVCDNFLQPPERCRWFYA